MRWTARRGRTVLLHLRLALATIGVGMSLTVASALAGVANRGLPSAPADPLAGMQWGVYTGPFFNSMYPYYAAARGPGTPLGLVRYAARRFNAQPHTTVYIDAGVRYWPMPFSRAVSMLEEAGIRYMRGFALNMTEYDSTSAELEYGARLVAALDAAGIPGKHFVLNTAENGSGFLNGSVPHPRVCRRRSEGSCVTLGIPPTTEVASPRWRLTRSDASLARRYADAYLWGGRPWLGGTTGGFDLHTALELAASTPW